MKTLTYTFGVYDDSPDGMKFTALASKKCDSDCQAERYAATIAPPTDMDGNERLSVVIRRGGSEWRSACRTS